MLRCELQGCRQTTEKQGISPVSLYTRRVYGRQAAARHDDDILVTQGLGTGCSNISCRMHDLGLTSWVEVTGVELMLQTLRQVHNAGALPRSKGRDQDDALVKGVKAFLRCGRLIAICQPAHRSSHPHSKIWSAVYCCKQADMSPLRKMALTFSRDHM